MKPHLPLALLLFPLDAAADVTVGPWSFADDAFADVALQLEPGDVQLWGGASDLTDALTGHSPDQGIVNIGLGSNANLFQLEFTDLMAENAPGPDLVLFDCRFSADPYEISVRPLGGVFTPFVPYAAGDFVDSGVEGTLCRLWGLPVDLDDFGLAPDAVVDAIQFRALPNARRLVEGDPMMCGVLSGGGGIGEPYCTALPTSLGVPASITATGSTSIAAGDLTLRAEPVPNQAFVFFFGPTQIDVPFGNGRQCVGGGITRILPPSTAVANVALRSLAPASVGITPGTVHFQCWFRDPAAGGAFFNTSDGYQIVFTL